MPTSPVPQHRDALAPDTVLNGFHLRAVLGRGGFGITYRASDLLYQSFAIKEFFPRQFAMRAGLDVVVASQPDQAVFLDCRRRFLTEARLLASLGSNGGTPGIVRVVTFFEANNTAYSVMELLAGETLDELLKAKGGPLSPQRVISLLQGILTPLARVHEAGFLHRDIKPANILIGLDGRPVLIDFGSARDMGPSANTTYTQLYSGHYAPIEQMMHGVHQGPFSDIYSVGGIAYRAIGGTLVDARTRQQATLRHAPDPMVPAVEIGRNLYPTSLLEIIDHALAVESSDRPQSVEEMLDLLKVSANGDPTIRRDHAMGNRERIGDDSARPDYPDVTSLSRVRPPSPEEDRLSFGGHHAPHKQNWRHSLPSWPRAAVIIAVTIFLGSLGLSTYLWFGGQNQPSRALDSLHVIVERSGNEIVARFPKTTDTATLIRALPHLIMLKVTAIDLSATQVVTLPPLRGLTELKKLDLHDSELTTLPSLEGLAALRDLDLARTKVTTLPSLQGLTALRSLDLNDTKVTTLPPLQGLGNLRVTPESLLAPPESLGRTPEPVGERVVPSDLVSVSPQIRPAPAIPAPAPAEDSWSPDDRRSVRLALRLLRITSTPVTQEPFDDSERRAIGRMRAMASAHPLGGAAGDVLHDPRALGLRLTTLLTRLPASPRGIPNSDITTPESRYARGWEAETGPDHDVLEAMYWYGLAARVGDLRAWAQLGRLLVLSHKDAALDSRDAAIVWWVASQGGNAVASFNLGALYDRSSYVPRDPTLALHWYNVALSQGSKDAVEALRKLAP